MRRVLLFLFIMSMFPVSGQDYVISTGPISNVYIEFFGGFIIDVYNSMGMDVILEHTSMEKSLALVNKGAKDAELFRAAIVEEKYPNLIRVDEPLFIIEITAFYLKEDMFIEDWESLRDCKITHVRGVKTYEKGLEGFPSVIPSDTLEIAFTLLKKGRVDVVVTGKLNGLQMSKKVGMPEQLKLSKPINSVPVYHFVHKDHSDLLEPLAEQIKLSDINSYMEQFLK